MRDSFDLHRYFPPRHSVRGLGLFPVDPTQIRSVQTKSFHVKYSGMTELKNRSISRPISLESRYLHVQLHVLSLILPMSSTVIVPNRKIQCSVQQSFDEFPTSYSLSNVAGTGMKVSSSIRSFPVAFLTDSVYIMKLVGFRPTLPALHDSALSTTTTLQRKYQTTCKRSATLQP